MNKRRWSSEVSVEANVGYLYLTHPDGRNSVHLFSPRVVNEVNSLNWRELGKYASATVYPREETMLHWIALGLSPKRGKIENVDHINRNTYDSRDENIRLVSVRQNSHNREGQEIYGPCVGSVIRGTGRYTYYEVSVSFGPFYLFKPTFKTSAMAMECRDIYISIAALCDKGEREIPTKNELKSISDGLRLQNGA